jgi:hypothetical protein
MTIRKRFQVPRLISRASVALVAGGIGKESSIEKFLGIFCCFSPKRQRLVQSYGKRMTESSVLDSSATVMNQRQRQIQRPGRENIGTADFTGPLQDAVDFAEDRLLVKARGSRRSSIRQRRPSCP